MIFDTVVWTVILIDLYRIYNLNLDVYQLSFAASTVSKNFRYYYLIFFAIVLLFPPLINCVIDFICRDWEASKNTISTKRKNAIFVVHLITAFAFTLLIPLSLKLQQLSGHELTSGLIQSVYEYTPFPLSFTSLIVGGVAGTAILSLLGRLLYSLFSDKTTFEREGKLWFNLSDIAKEYFPRQKLNVIFVNTASMAPPISLINTTEERHRTEYQNLVPTSDNAKEYLKKYANHSRKFIREYLFRDSNEKSKFSIEFLPGTSRGLEVGLSQIEGIDKIILSPYEHPSQYDVVKWFADLKPHIRHKMLEIDYPMLEKSWEEQKKWMIELIKDELEASEPSQKIAILLSEVHYISGLYINTKEVIEAIRPHSENSKIVFIIDGSQAVGNILEPFDNLDTLLRGEDFYYFSAHKWLLSPNTCGVIVARVDPDKYRIKPYDLFLDNELPTASLEPGVIFGTYAGLEFLMEDNKYHLIKFDEKSKSIKKYFKDNIGEQFEVVGSSVPEMDFSNFLALHPSKGHDWKDDDKKRFWTAITKANVDLTLVDVIENGEETWWLRISFPYFLQLHSIKQLIGHLQKRVKSIN